MFPKKSAFYKQRDDFSSNYSYHLFVERADLSSSISIKSRYKTMRKRKEREFSQSGIQLEGLKFFRCLSFAPFSWRNVIAPALVSIRLGQIYIRHVCSALPAALFPSDENFCSGFVSVSPFCIALSLASLVKGSISGLLDCS